MIVVRPSLPLQQPDLARAPPARSWRRGWTAARRAAAPAAGSRAPAPAPPAAAGRPRARAAGGAPKPSSRTSRSISSTRARDLRPPSSRTRARRRRSRATSGAETARSSGTPGRSRAGTAARRVMSRPPMLHVAGGRRRRSPATMRSVVVLPQPDGPSRTTSSPSAISSETSRDRDGCAPGKPFETRIERKAGLISPLATAEPAGPAASARRRRTTTCAAAIAATSGSIRNRGTASTRSAAWSGRAGQEQRHLEVLERDDEGKQRAGDDAAAHRRQRHPPDHGQRPGAEARGRFLRRAVVVGEGRRGRAAPPRAA